MYAAPGEGRLTRRHPPQISHLTILDVAEPDSVWILQMQKGRLEGRPFVRVHRIEILLSPSADAARRRFFYERCSMGM